MRIRNNSDPELYLLKIGTTLINQFFFLSLPLGRGTMPRYLARIALTPDQSLFAAFSK